MPRYDSESLSLRSAVNYCIKYCNLFVLADLNGMSTVRRINIHINYVGMGRFTRNKAVGTSSVSFGFLNESAIFR